MNSSHHGTGKPEPQVRIPIPTDALQSEPTVAVTPNASHPSPSSTHRSRACLALILQPGYDVIHRGLMPKLSSRDLTRLRQAASDNLHLLRNMSSPYLPQPQVHCQNLPPLPMVWRGIQGSDWLGWTEQEGPRQPCQRELQTENIGVDLAVCDGYRLGLPTGVEHGADFLVCHRCESLGKSQQGMVWPGTSIKLVGDIRATAELCATCALDRQILRPYAECQCESQFDKLVLCWDCRTEYPRQWLLDVICEAAASLPAMDPSVDPAGNTWSTLERWVLPPAFEPRSGCLDCGVNYMESAQTWLNLWTANEAPGRETHLAYMTTPQAEKVCLYCLSPARRDRHA
jgi:hypothetical protein